MQAQGEQGSHRSWSKSLNDGQSTGARNTQAKGPPPSCRGPAVHHLSDLRTAVFHNTYPSEVLSKAPGGHAEFDSELQFPPRSLPTPDDSRYPSY